VPFTAPRRSSDNRTPVLDFKPWRFKLRQTVVARDFLPDNRAHDSIKSSAMKSAGNNSGDQFAVLLTDFIPRIGTKCEFITRTHMSFFNWFSGKSSQAS
jgi:hypothetical protein